VTWISLLPLLALFLVTMTRRKTLPHVFLDVEDNCYGIRQLRGCY
jgi:hypothetical protein